MPFIQWRCHRDLQQNQLLLLSTWMRSRCEISALIRGKVRVNANMSSGHRLVSATYELQVSLQFLRLLSFLIRSSVFKSI